MGLNPGLNNPPTMLLSWCGRTAPKPKKKKILENKKI
jgi:hypothetical protein